MSVHNIFRVGGNCVAGAILMIAFAPIGMCQTAPNDENRAEPADVSDEVSVDDKKSTKQLRQELDEAEANFFVVFNSINSDDEYDVECDYESSLGSRRKQQVCTPKFARRIGANSTSDMLNEGRWDAPSPAGSRMQKKKELMRQEMTELLSTHAEFSRVFNDFAFAKRAYESARERQ